MHRVLETILYYIIWFPFVKGLKRVVDRESKRVTRDEQTARVREKYNEYY